MGQPVKLSDNLMLDARLVAEESERSIAGQIEYWARLGRAIEAAIRPTTARKLKARRAEPLLSECLREVESPAGRERAKAFLASAPFPQFSVSDCPGHVVKIDADGTRTLGRFVKRAFVPVKDH
jgi:hypothetical protein